MVFATESEAKQFLVEKIAARAIAEGCPLSDYERRMLDFSESAPEFTSDSPSESRSFLDPDDFDEEFEARMANLLKCAYELDSSSDTGTQQAYRDALATLGPSDHYINWVARIAGLGPPMPKWLRPFKHVGLFVLLVVPALVAILIAGAGVWAAVSQASRSSGEIAGMSVVAIIFAGFGVFLFALWLRERRV
jgi:hypothetical protein